MFVRSAALALSLFVFSGPARADETRVDFRLDKIILGGKAPDWTRTAYVSLTLRDGKAEFGKIGAVRGGGIGGWNVIPWAGRVDSLQVQQKGDKLTGTIRAYISSTDVPAGVYTIDLAADIKDGKVAGKFNARIDDLKGEGSIVGETKTVAAPVVIDPDDCVYALVLDKAMPKGQTLKLFLDRKDGKFRSAFACSVTFSRRPYEVDASGLALKNGELAGTIKLLRSVGKTKDNPLLGTFEIKSKIQGSTVAGTHVGAFEENKGAGDIWGETLVRPKVPEPTKVWVKLEDGLFGGADWQNRAFFDFVLTLGKAAMGKLFNNKGVYMGRLDSADLTLTGDRVRGTLRGTVLKGGVSAGTYTFELDGQAVGDVFVGHFTTRHGEKTKQGFFVGGFGKGNE